MESGKKSVEEKNRELAIAYAKYLRENNLKPGDATFVEPEELGLEAGSLDPEVEEPDINYEPVQQAKLSARKQKFRPAKAIKKEKPAKKVVKEKKERKLYVREFKPEGKGMIALEKASSAPLFLMDRIADRFEGKATAFGQSLIAGIIRIISGYKNSRKGILTALLAVCILSSIMLVVFDHFTIYEYAYNGKVLGYVKSQEDVTNVLKVAGESLSEVNEKAENIEFTANDNISFRRIVANGKDADDADTTVNKLAYMTDIEVEASGIFDGDTLVTIVKDETSALELLETVKKVLGEPDDGMEAVSVEFLKPLDIKPVKVLLSSVQSSSKALNQMTVGGKANFYHLVEEGETIAGLAESFGVGTTSIYDGDNHKPAISISTGDKICIRKEVEPVSVELIETGRMKEIIPFETIRKDSKDYYIGDEVVDVEGVDGVQIFEGTITKVGGEITDRDTVSVDVITEKVDKVILVGITERPKTAPTGTFHNPLDPGSYVVTSRPGWRWGRTHEGVDMGCPVGTPVYASDGGTVIRSSVYYGYGNCIDIEHDNGWITRYGHLNEFVVHEGDKVYQGQLIAYSGNTGHSTGPHLHFETRQNGVFVDPDTKVEGGL